MIVVGGAVFVAALKCFHFKLSISLRAPSPAERSKSCLPPPDSSWKGVGFNPFQHPNETFLFAPFAGWAIFHFKTSGLDLESDLSWTCTHSTQGGEAF